MQSVPSVVSEAAYMRARLVTGSQKTNVESLVLTLQTRDKLHRPRGASS